MKYILATTDMCFHLKIYIGSRNKERKREITTIKNENKNILKGVLRRIKGKREEKRRMWSDYAEIIILETERKWL